MHQFHTAVCCLCLVGLSIAGFAQDKQKDSKPYDKDQSSLAEMIEKNRSYKPGDLITWEDVEPYIKQLEENGVEIPDREKLPSLFLSDGDRVVKMMRTRKGTIFMRNLTKAGGKYDILDRFRRIPRGYTMLQMMIDTPKGHQMLADMNTTRVGKGMAIQLSRLPEGKDFTKPTGLIYTEEDLNAFLASEKKQDSTEKSNNTPKP